MPALVYLEGFEHQTMSVLQFGGVGTGIFDGTITNPGQITIDTSVFRNGVASLRVAANGAATNAVHEVSGLPTVFVCSVAIRLDSLPAADSEVFGFIGTVLNPLRLRFRASDSKWIARIEDSTADLVGPVAVAGTWHRFDFRSNISANPWVLAMQVDGVDFGSVTRATAASTHTRVRYGTNSAHTFTANYDDCVISVTSADYPIGDLKVLSLVPTSDGTHVGPANSIEDQAGVDIVTPGYTTAWQLVDEWPANSTDYVAQAVIGAGDYAEVNFGNTSETTIHDVMGIAALRSATTSASNGTTKVIRSDATEITIFSGDMSETALHYKNILITRPGGGWTQSEVNALYARMGFSSDATPDPWWSALMLQYASPVGAPPATTFPDWAGNNQGWF
jgi:hypothetical protein